MSKLQVMNFLYITLLMPRFLKWPQGFWKICGPQPLRVHVIHLFRRNYKNNMQCFMVCVDYMLHLKYSKPLTFLDC